MVKDWAFTTHCLICGASREEGFDFREGDCAGCERLWRQDLKDHRFPPGFVYYKELEDAGETLIGFYDWRELKECSRGIKIILERQNAPHADDKESLKKELEERDRILYGINSANKRELERLRRQNLRLPPTNYEKTFGKIELY